MNQNYLKIALCVLMSCALGFVISLQANNISPNGWQQTQVINKANCKKAIIFDIGNTLFKTSRSGMGTEIGLGHFVGYAVFDRKHPKKIHDLIFQVLHRIKPVSSSSGARHTDGQLLPEIFNDWLSGRETEDQIVQKALQAIEHLDQQRFFASRREKRLVEKTIRAMFNPHTLAKHTHPVKGMAKLLEKCKQNPNNTPHIFSNLSKPTYDAMYFSRDGHRIFNHFDPRNIMISGNTGMVKPQPALFNLFLSTFNLMPHQCVFIDDRPENVAAATNCGMTGIIFKNSKQLERDLHARGII
jgi:putative hydrolase of the HAD superfamily